MTAGDKSEKLKGMSKEAAGEVTDDKDLKREGKLDKASGSAKEKLSKGVDKVKDRLSDED